MDTQCSFDHVEPPSDDHLSIACGLTPAVELVETPVVPATASPAMAIPATAVVEELDVVGAKPTAGWNW